MASPEERVGEALRRKKLTVSAAESCTGGRIGDKITNVPGCSDYFRGSAVTYSNASKVALLGVDKATLERFGAVSEQVAKEMALGCIGLFGSDVSVSSTGIAGPTGGYLEKPVGLVWFAVTDGERISTEKAIFPGDRESIKEAAALFALEMVAKFAGGR
jgi:nicotinamide-nucleotide amidase